MISVSSVQGVAGYRGLLAQPVLRRLAVADVCARLPQGMVSLTLLLVAAQHASMTVAGLVVAGYTLGQAATGPVRGRLADRHGLVPVAAVCTAGYALALGRPAGRRAGRRAGRGPHRHRDRGQPGQPPAQPGPAQPVVGAHPGPAHADRLRPGRRRVRPGLHHRPGAGQRAGRRTGPGGRGGRPAGADRRGPDHHRRPGPPARAPAPTTRPPSPRAGSLRRRRASGSARCGPRRCAGC